MWNPTNQTMTPFMVDNDFIHIIKTNTCFKTSTGTCYCKNNSFEKIGFLTDVSSLPEKTNYTELENQFLRVLNKHAPLKSKLIRGNSKSFVTKTLRKAIMWRSASKKKAKNLNDLLSIKLYRKQRNYVINLNWNTKKGYSQKHIP